MPESNPWRRAAALAARGRTAAVGLALRVVGILAALAAQVFAARMLGVGRFGEFALAIAWTNVIVIFATFGYDHLSLREVAVARDEQWRLRTFLRHASVTLGLTTVAVCAVFAFGVTLARPSIMPALSLSLYLAVAAIPFLVVLNVAEAILRGLGAVVGPLLPRNVVQPLVFVAAGMLAAFVAEMTAPLAVAIHAASLACASGIAILFLRQRMTQSRPSDASRLRRDEIKAEHRAWRLAGARFLLYSGSGFLLAYVDTVLVGAFKGASEAGIYNLAFRISLVVSIILFAVNFQFAPTFARSNAMGDIGRMQRLAKLAALTAGTGAVVTALAIGIGSPLLFRVFGEGFDVARTPLVFLLVAQVANAFGGPAALVLNMTGNEKDSSRVLAVSLVTNIALNLVAIPLWGATGAALTTLASTIMWNAWMHVLIRRRFGVSFLIGV